MSERERERERERSTNPKCATQAGAGFGCVEICYEAVILFMLSNAGTKKANLNQNRIEVKHNKKKV